LTANHYVSYFRPYLAEGDILIFASQYTAGLAEGTYRNHFGNALIQDLGNLTTDHRNADLASAIDPTTVSIDIYELGGEEAPMLHYLTLGDETHKLTITNALDWLAKRNTVVADGGYSGSTDVFLITDVADLLDANAGDTLAAYATVVLFAEDGTVKAVRSIINNIEYTIAGGWAINANYTSGTVLVGELQALIEEGDYLLIGKSSTVVDGTTLAPRNFLAYHFMGSWESGSSEIWRNTTITEDFIDPNTATPSIDSYEATMFLALATETQHLVRVSAEEWLELRNYTVADGGLADTKDIIYIYDAAALLDMDPEATLTTYSTVVVIGADGTVKLVRSITVGIEYLYTNDQEVDNGWTVGSYATGVVKLSEIQGVLEEGDIILIGRSSAKQNDSLLLSPRDFLAYHFIGTWDTATAGAEIWRSTDTTQFINPNDATFAFEYAPVRDAVTIADESLMVTTTTAADWIALRNTLVADGGYAGSTDLFLIEDAYALNDLADTTVLLEKNATIVVFDQDGNVKAVRSILNTHEWLATNDQLVDNGWTMNSNYASGLVYVDELLPYLAEGDYILIGKSSAIQDGATLSTRDFLAYHFMGTWEGAGSEIWRSTTITEDFIDPTTVVLTMEQVVVQP
jgi:hypothetical protein